MDAAQVEQSDRASKRLKGEASDDVPLVIGNQASLMEAPLVNFKDILSLPLPDFQLDLSGNASSNRPGMKPETVYQMYVAKEIRTMMEALPAYNMYIQNPAPACSVFQSEHSCNAEQQRVLFEMVNYVLAQWPEPGMCQQYRIRLNALQPDARHSDRESLGHRLTNTTSSLQPDNECLHTYNEDGKVDMRGRSAMVYEGKRWSVFSSKLSHEVIHSGKFDLAKAIASESPELSDDARSAVYQIVRYVIDRDLEEGILYCLMALWIVRIISKKPLVVSVSEVFTKDSVQPSMREVVFATTLKAIRRMEGKVGEARREIGAQGVDVGGSSNAVGPSEGGRTSGHLGGEASTSTFMLPPSLPSSMAAPGDDLMSSFEDLQAPIFGNSLVRIGRLRNGDVVAAKIVPSDDSDWVEELENEAKRLDELNALQGGAIPTKIFAGQLHGGKERLLVTKYVDGRRIDEVMVTPEVASNAKRVLNLIHSAGYLHGDVNARNILAKKSGDVVFVDFGKAKKGSKDAYQRERDDLEIALR